MQKQNQNSRGPTAPVTTTIPCSNCGEPQTVPLSEGVIARFRATLPRARPNIQVVFPQLTADEREMLKTELCPKCWGRATLDPDDLPRRSGHSDGEGYEGPDR